MTTSPTTSFAAFLGRLTWILVGPMLVLLTLSIIASRGGGWLTFADVLYFVVLGLMLLGRWAEFRSGTAQTMSGEPATEDHLRRYVLWTPVVGLLVWVVANVVGNHWWVN